MLKRLNSIIWMVSVLFCAIFAFIITGWIWQRWEHTPSLTNIDSLYYPISNVPFPSVTVCNMNLVYRPRMEKNFLNKMYKYLILVLFEMIRLHLNRIMVYKILILAKAWDLMKLLLDGH